MGATGLVRELRAAGPILSIGILTADLLHLGDELALLERVGARLVHTDVMDGVFCPQITVGPPLIRAQRTSLLKDAHLMIDEPEAKAQAFVDAGADIVVFQVEGTRHPHRVLQVLGKATNANDPDRGILRGVALNPGTPLAAIEPLLADLEYVMLLAVNPGWPGQAFIPATEDRVASARELIRAAGRDILLGVDGGVTKANVQHVASLGVDIIVTGSAVFDGKTAEANAREMLALARAPGASATQGVVA